MVICKYSVDHNRQNNYLLSGDNFHFRMSTIHILIIQGFLLVIYLDFLLFPYNLILNLSFEHTSQYWFQFILGCGNQHKEE